MTTAPALETLHGTVGVWTSQHEQHAPTATGGVAALLDELGFRALWFPEAWGRESFTSAQLLLSASSRLHVATGITNIWGRDAVAAANAARTLNAAFDDRFVLGLGVSHQPLVERLRGHQYESPLAHMRAYLEALRAAPMRAIEGEYPFPTVIAALGPKMLELGAQLADGVHTYLVNVEHTATARQIIGDAFLAVEQAVVLGGTREEFLERAHTHLEYYTGLENYRANWRRLGFDDNDFIRGGSERLCDAMVVHGDETRVLAAIGDHFAAGASHVCLQVLPAAPAAIPEAEYRRLASALALS